MATKVQKTIVGDNSSYADLQGWAGDITASAGTGTGIAAALYNLGFTKTSDQYNAVWTGNALPQTNGSIVGATCFPAVANDTRTALAGSNFNLGTAGASAWVSGQTYAAGNVVTNGGFVYICISATSGSTAPGSDTTHWSTYFMEIWSVVSSGLTTFYVKLEYGAGAAVANPQLCIQFGTGYVTNSGVLSGNVSAVEVCFLGTATAASTECDWSGDGDNYFGMIMHRQSGTHSAFFAFERGISGQTGGAPVYSTTNQYITYVKGIPPTTGTWRQCSLFLGSVGTVNSNRLAYVAAVNLFVAGTQTINNISPALPVFPLVGWCGNPMTVLQVYSVTDSVEGTQVSSTVYGTSTTYLVTVNVLYVTRLGGTASIYGVGLKWV